MPQTTPVPPEPLSPPVAAKAPAADETEALTRATARGDTRAFGVLYARWFDHAYATARRLTGRDEAFCLDVVQEAMLKAARRIPTLPNEAAMSAWLCTVVHRAALDALRSERRRLVREHRAHPHTAHTARTTTDLDDRIAWLRERLGELSVQDRSLLAARFVRGRTLAQAGEEAGLTGDAVHGRVRRILHRLRLAQSKDAKENQP
ncbi:hypothetical protein MNBD_PLANCTO03-2136 [hydrothermal vent metagenome]|uniref:RNA polymerase sigma-70 region 2 domain-containing protein n=1 Tax=hydrothermal vent metagenome TaxID=652676 RepID=A0A3B1D6D6_9ZZZZ